MTAVMTFSDVVVTRASESVFSCDVVTFVGQCGDILASPSCCPLLVPTELRMLLMFVQISDEASDTRGRRPAKLQLTYIAGP